MQALKIRAVPTVMLFLLAGLGGFYLPMPTGSAIAPNQTSAETNP